MMRILAGINVIFILVMFSFGQQKPRRERTNPGAREHWQLKEKYNKRDRDGADPPPSVPPLPPGPNPQPAPIPPDPPVLGESKYEDTLDNYEVGEPIHERGELFCKRLAAKIREQVTSGRKVQRVIITGFADGIPNKGKVYDLTLLHPSCRNGVSSPLDDDELALLRGCVIFESLKETISEKYAGGEGWQKPETHDEPDGINQGGKYRKVHVEITFRRDNDERE
jgi:hypothetical protein